MKIKSLLPLIAVGFVTTVQAHYLWIEDTANQGLTVRFAEWPDEYETSPGHLDQVDPPLAWKSGTNGDPISFQVQRKPDQIQILSASSKDSVQVEAGFAVLTPAMLQAEGAPVASNSPSRKPIFYARWQPAGSGSAKPSLNFDIVPTGNAGEFRVYFRAQPVAGAVVIAHKPGGGEEKLTADEQGVVRFTADKPGLYLLTSKHQRETVKGFSSGVPYDVVSHNCAVTWRQP